MSLLIPGLLAATAEILQDTDLPVGALAADEECAVGADGCALNALQRKAQKAATGGEEIVAEVSDATAAHQSETNAAEESEAFVEPDEFDAEEPEAFVELEESEDEQQEGESAEEEQEAESAEEEQEGESAEEQDTKDELSGRRYPRYNNKCCKCSDGRVAWSHSGTCSPCHGRIKKKKNPTKACTQGTPQWPRHAQNWPRHCANECVKLFKNSGGHCTKETGGSCKIWSCKKSRGHTECVKGKCLCKQGYCARGGVCK